MAKIKNKLKRETWSRLFQYLKKYLWLLALSIILAGVTVVLSLYIPILCERARDGENVEAPVRIVHVESIELHEETPDHGVRMTIRCGRGTYIRSICDDLGKLTGCPAHMRFLLRAQSGVFTLDSAMTMEEAAAYQAQGTLQSHLLPLDYGIQHMPRADAPEWLRKQVCNGVKLPAKKLPGVLALPEGQVTRVYLRDEFWGMAAREGEFLVWKCLLPPEKEENNANHP